MPTGLVTRSQYTTNPPEQVSVDSELEVRGFYLRSFIAGDGVTPVQGNSSDGQQGPYYSIGASLNADGDLVVAAQEIQATTLSRPTSGYVEQLWVDGAYVTTLLPNTNVISGWQIPTTYGDPIAYDEIATYNRAVTLVPPPGWYDIMIQEILRLAGNFDYAAVGVNGITSMSYPPVLASLPIALGENDPRVAPSGTFVFPQTYGALGDGRRLSDAVMTSGSALLSSVLNPFTSADVNKLACVEGAGVGSATLSATVLSVNAGVATLSVSASTSTVAGSQAWIASNDTAAFQAAIDASYQVIVPAGIYGLTTLRLRQGSQLVGQGIGTTILTRMSIGSGGAFVGMNMGTHEVAQKVLITDLHIAANQIGTNNDGLELGTEGNNFAFANGSYINNVRVTAASGVGLNINSNVGFIGQVWVQSSPGIGTPAALSIPNSTGFKVVNTQLVATLISVEGRYENGDIILNAGGSSIDTVQSEPVGVYATKDLISIGGTGQTIGTIVVPAASATRRDLVRITENVQGVAIGPIFNVNSALSCTNILKDAHSNNPVLQITITTRAYMSQYRSDTSAGSFYDNNELYQFGKAVTMGPIMGPISSNSWLAVQAPTAGGRALKLTDGTNGTIFIDFPVANFGRIQGDTATGLRFGADTTDRMAITVAGKIGLRTVSPTADVTVAGSFALATKTALTPGSTVTIDSTLGNFFTLIPGQDETINATVVGVSGQELTIIISTSGSSSWNLTFGTNFTSQGVLATGTVTGKVFTIKFISNGVTYSELSRTIAQ